MLRLRWIWHLRPCLFTFLRSLLAEFFVFLPNFYAKIFQELCWTELPCNFVLQGLSNWGGKLRSSRCTRLVRSSSPKVLVLLLSLFVALVGCNNGNSNGGNPGTNDPNHVLSDLPLAGIFNGGDFEVQSAAAYLGADSDGKPVTLVKLYNKVKADPCEGAVGEDYKNIAFGFPSVLGDYFYRGEVPFDVVFTNLESKTSDGEFDNNFAVYSHISLTEVTSELVRGKIYIKSKTNENGGSELNGTFQAAYCD